MVVVGDEEVDHHEDLPSAAQSSMGDSDRSCASRANWGCVDSSIHLAIERRSAWFSNVFAASGSSRPTAASHVVATIQYRASSDSGAAASAASQNLRTSRRTRRAMTKS